MTDQPDGHGRDDSETDRDRPSDDPRSLRDERQTDAPPAASGAATTHDEPGRVAGETYDQFGAAGDQTPVFKVQPPESPAESPAQPPAGSSPQSDAADAGGAGAKASASAGSSASTGSHAFLVGAGILLSRIVGLIRQRVFAYYFGNSAAKDAFDAAFKIPNFLQNVFGEGALSASFIPVYAKLLANGDEREAGRVAGAIFSLLALVASLLVLVGVLAAPFLVDFIAPGFEGERRELALTLVRIFFPGAGLLVLSAWCLGVLNSHRRFFLSYAAPVIWNLAIIGALVVYGRRVGEFRLAEMAAWGSVVGSLLQFAVQLPTVLSVAKHLRLTLAVADGHVRKVLRNFFPFFTSRGVVQISGFIDSMIASLLGTGAVAALSYAQSIYTLPVSLFGMSVSAAELTNMSSAVGDREAVAAHLRRRLDSGLRQITFFVVPSVVACLALGDVIVGVLYRTGKFGRDEMTYVWAILAGSTVGLLASTLGRLYSSTYYALHDTRTPLRFAVLRVTLATALGYACAVVLPPLVGVETRWGAAGLTAASGLAGWVEFYLLRRTLNRRIGPTGLSAPFMLKLWAAALLCAAAGWGLKYLTATLHPVFLAATVLLPYGLLYFAATYVMRVPEARSVLDKFRRPLARVLGRGANR
jgi:putative peptidoglycan lipid II flippase